MNLILAAALSLTAVLLSAGVGWYLQRFKSAATEMLGMMIGMTLGMMTGVVVGYLVGAATDMFLSNLVGILVGVSFGIAFGRLGGLMGMMDGAMGGIMGGMMGGMLGVMLQYETTYVAITAVFIIALYLVALAALVRLVRQAVVVTFFVDPVCNMKVDASQAITLAHGGETYYFCAPACREAFVSDPGRYTGAGG